MKFGTKFVTMTAAVALVAAPAIAAAPAQAAPVAPSAKASGTTLISFKKEYAGIIKLIKPVAPAKFIGSKMTFPVTAVNGNVVKHSGGISINGTELSNPVITVNAAKKTAKIRMAFLGTQVEVFTAKHFKVKADGVDGQVWQGDLHLTKDKTVVKTLNEALGVNTLTPDVGLGQIRVTIKTA